MQKNSSIDNYEIIKEIGKGSFSNVYLVKKKDNLKEFALKKVNFSSMSSKEKENALKEVNFLAEIKDSNVIGYEESFYDNNANILYLVMEYAPFGDLNKIIADNNKLKIYYSEPELINIYLQIASGLKAIHEKHIIHRDLKSANIFIMQKNDLILKIGDFNVSKKIDYLNLKNTQTGTPYYASPEIWENKPYDFKSDIWSLGCLFYEIASLSTPFKGLNMKELFECIEKGIFAPLPKQYSNNITKIIKMCLRHDANLRPNIKEIKYFIENLKMELKFKRMYDEHYCENNSTINNNIYNNNYFYTNNTIVQNSNIKRPASYIKNNANINLENYKFENSNGKKNLNINNNNDNYIKSINIVNDKKIRNLTPIKINYHYLIKEKTPIKLNEKLNQNIINNGAGSNKLINHNFKANNNIMPIINNDRNSPQKAIKEYYNINTKPFSHNQIQDIKNEGQIIDKFKEKENKEHIIYKMEEQNQFIQKLGNIKSPLKQIDRKISANNTQSIPEATNNYPSQSSQNNDKLYKKCNYFLENDNSKCDILINNNINNKNYYNNENIKNLNEDIYIKEENNNLMNKINLKTNNNMINDKLFQLKPKGIFFQKKILKNIPLLNAHKRPVSNIITRSILNNNSDNISKIFDYYNNNITDTNNNNNCKINPRIKLKPITRFVRSITPFNDNHKKYDLKIIKNNNNLNLPNNIHNNNSITDLNNQNNSIVEINNNNPMNNNNDKSYFIRDKKNIRQLNINKNKLNNLSQIKTKFLNYVKPNYKNIEMFIHKTEI